ncbi:MAG: polysaccharide deacetylase family protein [Clostridia bacterium]|nr:polysaccharide deacetylase family protein [Clostridia bacterium]
MAFVCVAVATIFAFCIATRAVSTAAAKQQRKIPIYSVGTQDKRVCLTFDAAWGNEDTGQLIEILAQYNVKATFFVVGEWVDKYPESVKALSDAGHSIQNHSDTHPHLPELSREQVIAELQSCNDKIEAITGVRPDLVRVPYGDYNNAVLEAAQSIGMYTIQWDVDSLDWKELSADEIHSRVTGKVREGSIVLFHNAALHTPEALPSIIEHLQGEGYELVTVGELIYRENYTIDHEGRQNKS